MNAPERDIFFASYEHVRRAEGEFQKLKPIVNGFIESDPYTVETRRHETGKYVVAQLRVDLPEDLAWGAMCVIERLRSALDGAIFKIVEANGRGTSGVGFPFGGIDGNTGKPNAFPDGRMTRKGGVKEKLTPDQWDFIEAQRPYPGGNDLLWGINEVANAVKHRATIVEADPHLDQSVVFGIGPSASFSMGGRSTVRPADCDFILRDKERETVLLFTDGKGFNEKINLSVTPHVVFSNIPPVRGKDILTTLNQQIRMTKFILGGLRRTV